MKNIISLLGMTVLASSLLGCSTPEVSDCVAGYSKPDWAALKTQLAQQKQLWIGKNLKTYAYSVRELNFTPVNFPLRVTVKDGSVVTVVPVLAPGQSGALWTEPADKSGYLMERQFTRLETNLSGVETQTCPIVVVKYDTTYGFPQQQFYDTAAERAFSDSDVTLTISDFTP
jgi:hypothetical protein